MESLKKGDEKFGQFFAQKKKEFLCKLVKIGKNFVALQNKTESGNI